MRRREDQSLGSSVANSYEETQSQMLMEDEFGLDQIQKENDFSLVVPNLEEMRKKRRHRTKKAMEVTEESCPELKTMAVNPVIAHQIIPEKRNLTKEERAATDIQRIFRGYLGRREYLERLYEKYCEEEAEMEAKRRLQVEEGGILIDTYRIERELEDQATLRRNRPRSAASHATTIQRAWRSYQRKKSGITETCSDPIDIGSAEFGYNDNEFPLDHSSYYRQNSTHDEVFDDSLENADGDDEDEGSIGSDSPELARSFPGDYMIDDEFSGTFDTMDFNFRRCKLDSEPDLYDYPETFPVPATDWDKIESILKTESGINTPEDGTDGEDQDISSKFSLGPQLQMCFVDDGSVTESTDNESDPEVKVYIVDDDQNMSYLDRGRTQSYSSTNLADSERDIESRDSGCVPGDLVDLNIEHVTDLTPEQHKNVPAPEEESKRVLKSLEIHEEHECKVKEREQQKKKNSVVPDSIYLKSLEELRILKNELELKVMQISDDLVQSLMKRDALHAEHESLLMDVEDLTKLIEDILSLTGLHEERERLQLKLLVY